MASVKEFARKVVSKIERVSVVSGDVDGVTNRGKRRMALDGFSGPNPDPRQPASMLLSVVVNGRALTLEVSHSDFCNFAMPVPIDRLTCDESADLTQPKTPTSRG